MTKTTVNGVTTTTATGHECYETFHHYHRGRHTHKYVEYDYRHTDGELFSCVKPTLELCRAARDEWLRGRAD